MSIPIQNGHRVYVLGCIFDCFNQDKLGWLHIFIWMEIREILIRDPRENFCSRIAGKQRWWQKLDRKLFLWEQICLNLVYLDYSQWNRLENHRGNQGSPTFRLNRDSDFQLRNFDFEFWPRKWSEEPTRIFLTLRIMFPKPPTFFWSFWLSGTEILHRPP